MKINHSAVILAVLAGFVIWLIWLVVTRSPDAIVLKSSS